MKTIYIYIFYCDLRRSSIYEICVNFTDFFTIFKFTEIITVHTPIVDRSSISWETFYSIRIFKERSIIREGSTISVHEVF